MLRDTQLLHGGSFSPAAANRSTTMGVSSSSLVLGTMAGVLGSAFTLRCGPLVGWREWCLTHGRRRSCIHYTRKLGGALFPEKVHKLFVASSRIIFEFYKARDDIGQ